MLKRIKPGFFVVLLLALMVTGMVGASASGPLAPAAPVSTAFTYQGSLTDNGSPANGSYDFFFSPFDAASGGVQVADTQIKDDVAIVDGYFAVTLDFGTGLLEGDARWLEVDVRPGASTGSYTTLSPRIALSGVPYALSLRPGAVVNTSEANVPAIRVGAPNANSNALVATGNANGYAVIYGEDQSTTGGYGVYGKSGTGTGVRGESTLASGVVGISGGQFNGGVFGQNTGSGYGVYGQATGGAGVYGQSTNQAGVVGESSGHDGVRGTTTAANRIGVKGVANATGSVGVWGESAANTGVFGLSTSGNAVWGMSTDGAAIRANSTNGNGVHAPSAGHYGVFVESSGSTGIRINDSGGFGLAVSGASLDGISVFGAGDYAGYFGGDVLIEGTCTGCLQANFAVNAGQRVLEPGDAVSIQAVTSSDFDGAPTLWQVVPAQPGQAVVGVVAGRAAEEVPADEEGDKYNQRLVPRNGAAQPGEYVTIVYSGPMQVKVAPGENAIVAGSRVTAATDGTVRPLQTRTVDDMIVSEGAPVIGVALDAAKDGLVWVLVNPQ